MFPALNVNKVFLNESSLPTGPHATQQPNVTTPLLASPTLTLPENWLVTFPTDAGLMSNIWPLRRTTNERERYNPMQTSTNSTNLSGMSTVNQDMEWQTGLGNVSFVYDEPPSPPTTSPFSQKSQESQQEYSVKLSMYMCENVEIWYWNVHGFDNFLNLC